jgi:class 3 adenylate cyclase
MTASGEVLAFALLIGAAIVVWGLRRLVKPYLDEAIAARDDWMANAEPFEPPHHAKSAAAGSPGKRNPARRGRMLLLPLLPFALLADPRTWLREVLSDCAEAPSKTLRLLILASHILNAPSRIWVVWSGRCRKLLQLLPRVHLDGRLVYRLVLVVDIEGYRKRTAQGQQRAQDELCRVLDSAANRASPNRSHWDRQVRGDGELAILPHDVDIPRFIGDFTREMTSALAEINRGRETGQRLRVRLALHYGTLAAGSLGPAGDAPVVASQLVDMDAGRRFLDAHPERDIAVIVSSSLYGDVVSTGFCSLNPADFEVIRDVIKGVSYHGFIYGSEQDGDRLQDQETAHRPLPR